MQLESFDHENVPVGKVFNREAPEEEKKGTSPPKLADSKKSPLADQDDVDCQHEATDYPQFGPPLPKKKRVRKKHVLKSL